MRQNNLRNYLHRTLRFEALEVRALMAVGDANTDGRVDAADYVVWRNALGSHSNPTADLNFSGSVDAEDYAVWKSHFGKSIASVAQYGAVPNDGIDDTAAIQRAINANVDVYFPSGEYWTTSKLTVPSGRTLYGPEDDNHARIRVRFDLPSTANNYAFQITGNDVVLQNLVIDKDFVDGSYGIGILAENRSNLKFVGLEIKDYSVRYGIHLIECHSFRISDSSIHDFLFNDANAGGNESDMIQDSPAGIRITRSTNGTIANCLIQNIEVGPQGRASISELVPSYGPQGYQADGITVHDSSSILVENNDIWNSGELIDLVVSDNCVVRNNNLQMAFLFVIKCIGSQSCLIQSNFVADGAIGIFLADHSAEQCTSNIVDDNDIVNCGSPGVWNIVAHNRHGFAISGIYLDSNASGNKVSRNRIYDYHHYLSQFIRQGSGSNIVTDNDGFHTEFGTPAAGRNFASLSVHYLRQPETYLASNLAHYCVALAENQIDKSLQWQYDSEYVDGSES